MKKEEKGFTLIELLSVIVILGITFMFILPSLTELFTMGNKTEIELIEERVLTAAKEYVNNIDGNFYKSLYKEGDTNYIYKSDLINAGLIDEEEISKLNTFAGVKGEVIKNDRIRYTVEYINASNNEYTNEELYLMMQNLTNEVQTLKNQVGNSGGNTTNISLLSVYPVGSIYISENNTSPKELFGGEWEQLKDRFLLGAGDTYTAGSTGGESEHTLTKAELPNITGDFYSGSGNIGSTAGGYGAFRTAGGVFTAYNVMQYGQTGTSYLVKWPSGDSYSNVKMAFGNNQPHNNLPPYITVYMWKRIA